MWRVKTGNHPLVWKEKIMSRRDHKEFLVSGLTLGTWMLVDDHAYDKRKKTDSKTHKLIILEDTKNQQPVKLDPDTP